MLPLVLLVIFFVWHFTRPKSISVVPTKATAIAAPTAAGHIEVIPKAKYIELKKISNPNPGNPEYAGIINIKKIMVTPEDNSMGGFGITATASSSLGGNTPDQVVNYGNTGGMWHSKLTPNFGEWIRLELSKPAAIKKIMIINRTDAPGGTDHESMRIIGTQVTILDADRNPIKTYVIANNGLSFEFAGH